MDILRYVGGVAAFDWDIPADLCTWRGDAEALLGLDPSVVVSFERSTDIVDPNDRSQFRKTYRQAMAAGGAFTLEFRLARVHPLRWIEMRGVVSRDSGGRSLRMTGVCLDITANLEVREALRLSEERLAGIVEGAVDAIISIDQHHCITLFNPGAEVMFRWSAADVVGRPLDILLPMSAHAVHQQHVDRFRIGKVASRRMGERSRIFGLRRDGTVFPAEASISKSEFRGGTVFTVILRDVTDQKVLEEALERRVAERNAELEGVLEAVPDGILTFDAQHKVVMANGAALEGFGYDLVGMKGLEADRLCATAEDAKAAEVGFHLLESGEHHRPVMINCRRSDGSNFPALWIGNAIRDAAGRTTSRVCLVRDMSEELERQRVLQHSQRMEAVGQLTGGLAHDFNNLLTVITGNLELLDLRIEDERSRDLIRRADEAARMGARLTGRLLTFSRRRKLQPTVLNLNDTVIAMMELLNRALGETILVNSQLSPGLWTTRVDASEIENAILNLAINARDAMPYGGKLLIETNNVTLSSEETAVNPDAAPGPHVKLSVSDTGVGMTPEVVARAFEPFFTTKGVGRGTGLGLSTIYGFVRQSGGLASITSEPGQGTIVSISLPRDFGPSANDPTDPTSVPSDRGQGETILLVEDNEQIRVLVARRLHTLGYHTLIAVDGATAIEILNDAKPVDLLFSDVVMPGGVSGFDLVRWVQQHRPSIKVLLTSGFAPEVIEADKAASASTQLLRKPYTQIELAMAVRKALTG